MVLSVTQAIDQIKGLEDTFRDLPPPVFIRSVAQFFRGKVLVSSNFQPYSAVMLHLCVSAHPRIPVLWVDHGYNKPETYVFMEKLKKRLDLNLHVYTPRMTPAHRDAVYGPIPSVLEEDKLKEFSALMKIEPFRRGMSELRPMAWLTGLRRAQNPGRAGLEAVSFDRQFSVIKVNPILSWTDEDMASYLKKHDLPNETSYFDPAKGDAHRECGLHRT